VIGAVEVVLAISTCRRDGDARDPRLEGGDPRIARQRAGCRSGGARRRRDQNSGSGPDPEQRLAMLTVSVQEYDIADVRPVSR
jgi:hypothetical protein